MPSSKMQAFSGIIEQNSEFSLTFYPFFVPFFSSTEWKIDFGQRQQRCVGSSRVQMDTHLSIINMPLSASGMPSWAVGDHCVTLSEVRIILIWSELLPSHSTVLLRFFVDRSRVNETASAVNRHYRQDFFALSLSGIRSLAMQLYGTMILAATTDASRCGHEQRDQKYDSNLPDNLEA